MTSILPTLADVRRTVLLLAVATRDTQKPRSNLVEPALLAQLRANITPDGTSGTGGAQAHTRSVVNFAALDLYQYLTDRIGILYEQATDTPSTGVPEEMLIGWHLELALADATQGLHPAQLEVAYEQVDDFRTRIMDLFHPPEHGEMRRTNGTWAACPECGWSAITADTADGPVRKGALVQLVRDWRSEASVRCRKCNTTWTGGDAIKELQAEIGRAR